MRDSNFSASQSKANAKFRLTPFPGHEKPARRTFQVPLSSMEEVLAVTSLAFETVICPDLVMNVWDDERTHWWAVSAAPRAASAGRLSVHQRVLTRADWVPSPHMSRICVRFPVLAGLIGISHRFRAVRRRHIPNLPKRCS